MRQIPFCIAFLLFLLSSLLHAEETYSDSKENKKEELSVILSNAPWNTDPKYAVNLQANLEKNRKRLESTKQETLKRNAEAELEKYYARYNEYGSPYSSYLDKAKILDPSHPRHLDYLSALKKYAEELKNIEPDFIQKHLTPSIIDYLVYEYKNDANFQDTKQKLEEVGFSFSHHDQDGYFTCKLVREIVKIDELCDSEMGGSASLAKDRLDQLKITLMDTSIGLSEHLLNTRCKNANPEIDDADDVMDLNTYFKEAIMAKRTSSFEKCDGVITPETLLSSFSEIMDNAKEAPKNTSFASIDPTMNSDYKYKKYDLKIDDTNFNLLYGQGEKCKNINEKESILLAIKKLAKYKNTGKRNKMTMSPEKQKDCLEQFEFVSETKSFPGKIYENTSIEIKADPHWKVQSGLR